MPPPQTKNNDNNNSNNNNKALLRNYSGIMVVNSLKSIPANPSTVRHRPATKSICSHLGQQGDSYETYEKKTHRPSGKMSKVGSYMKETSSFT